ncbi:MAG: hypothetical protein JSS27_12470 [Planctomycetes bacterium]|nr:hypothetical protein [Planctomycetota bacterium]
MAIDYRPRQRMPNYQARGTQYRLLGLVMLLGMSVILIEHVADPRHWNWFAEMGQPQIDRRKVDTRLAPERAAEFEGEPRIEVLAAAEPAEPEQSPPPKGPTDNEAAVAAAIAPAASPAAVANPPAANPPPVNPPAAPAAELQAQPAAGEPGAVDVPVVQGKPAVVATSGEDAPGWLPGMKAEAYREVEDDAKLRAPEKRVIYQLLSRLATYDATALKKLSIGPTTWIQLYNELNIYRGRVVTVRGTVRIVGRTEAAANENGLTAYYELWFTPSDRPTHDLICLYALNVPDSIPLGKQVEESFEAEAILVKRLAYMAEKDRTWRTAPLMVAGPLRWLPKANPVAANDAKVNEAAHRKLITTAVVVIGLPIAVLIGFWAMRQGKAPKNPYSAFPTATGRGHHEFQKLHDLEVDPTVLEALKNIDQPKPGPDAEQHPS